MTRLLVDTSAYSAFFKGHEDIKRWFQRAEEIYLNPVILGELRAGFRRGRHRENNEERLRQFLASPRVSVVGIDEGTADRYAVILNGLWDAGTPVPTNDMWIAATAMQYGFEILTTDLHYQKIPQAMVHCLPAR